MIRTSDSNTGTAAPTLVSAKIRPVHQERLALVYVRQSSTKQVEENIESTEMQYRLVDRAAAMGWSDGRIEVIDDDLGMSGRSVEYRIGFQRMIAEVSMGHVGIIFSIEMSRLARSCRDWHQLLENCSLFGTLLADADGVYDPRDHNDRLLLGLKGTMSEAELHVLQRPLPSCQVPGTVQSAARFRTVPHGSARFRTVAKCKLQFTARPQFGHNARGRRRNAACVPASGLSTETAAGALEFSLVPFAGANALRQPVLSPFG